MAIIIYMTGRCLAGIPRPRNRMIARTFTCVIVAVCVVLPCLSLMPLYMPANAVLPFPLKLKRKLSKGKTYCPLPLCFDRWNYVFIHSWSLLLVS